MLYRLAWDLHVSHSCVNLSTCGFLQIVLVLRNLIEILLFKAVTLVVTLHINGDDFMQSSILNA